MQHPRRDLVVRLLGPPRFWRNGEPLPLRRRTATVAAMALLAPAPLSRSTVAERLWPDAEIPAANLRPILTDLRQVVGGLVQIGRSTVGRGDAGVADVDIHLLEEAVDPTRTLSSDTAARLAQIVTTSSGQLLEGLDEPDNDVLTEWLEGERQRIEQLLRRAQQVALEGELARGEVEAAIGIARLQAERSPYDDEVNNQLVGLLLRAGQRTSALEHAANYSQRIRDDIGIGAPATLHAMSAGAPEPQDGRPTDALIETVPVPAGRLVGRVRELEDLRALVERSRLVTLTGPGGVGKSRLATETARALSNQGSRVIFVRLEDATAGGAADVIAARLRLTLNPGDVTPQIAEYLGALDAVLILDGCGQVRDEIALLVDHALRSTQAARFVVTSRQPLEVLGEVVQRIGPLPQAAPADARDLFFDRALAAGVRLERDRETVSTVDLLCRRLDGLPLAIEMAATMTGRRSLHEILQQLSEEASSDTAAVGSRLAGVVDSSVRLLSDGGRDLFVALGTLVGSFDVDAAAAVAGIAPRHAAQLLEELADHSLVLPAGPRRHLGRHRLLRLVRTRARRLAGESLADATARHAAHFRSRCGRLDLFDLRSHVHTERMEPDIANYTAAFDHFAGRGSWQAAAEIAIGCYGVFATHGWTRRGRTWLERCLEHERLLDRTTAERARGYLVQICLILDDGEGIERHGSCLADAEDLRIRAEATGTRALPLLRTDFDRARALVSASLEAAEQAGVPGSMVWPRAYLGFQRMYEGRLQEALELFDSSIAEARSLGHTGHLWILEDSAASCALMLGDPSSVIDRLDGLDRPESMWDARHLLVGLAHLEMGDLSAAREEILRFADPAERRRLPRSANDALVGLAHLAAAGGNGDHALHLLGSTGPGRMPVSIGLGRRLAARLDGTERVEALRRALEAQGRLFASADSILAREWSRARADEPLPPERPNLRQHGLTERSIGWSADAPRSP